MITQRCDAAAGRAHRAKRQVCILRMSRASERLIGTIRPTHFGRRPSLLWVMLNKTMSHRLGPAAEKLFERGVQPALEDQFTVGGEIWIWMRMGRTRAWMDWDKGGGCQDKEPDFPRMDADKKSGISIRLIRIIRGQGLKDRASRTFASCAVRRIGCFINPAPSSSQAARYGRSAGGR